MLNAETERFPRLIRRQYQLKVGYVRLHSARKATIGSDFVAFSAGM
jgi:hypothetical protein